MTHSEGMFTGARAREIYYQYWRPTGAPRAVLLIVHGAGEHSSRYKNLATFFTKNGYAVAALDHPGHGKSQGRYGHIERFDDFVKDVDIFQQQVSREFPGLPLVLLGHSMGGLISCVYLLQHQQDFVGCVLSGAAIKTDIEPGVWEMGLIRCLSVLAPGKGVLQLDASGVSRDPAVVEDYVNDPLVNHGKMSARMVAELFAAMRRAQAGAKEITLPLMILHGAEDTMASPEGSRFLYDNASSAIKALEIFPGLYHEVFNEPEHEAVFADVLVWCDERVAGTASVIDPLAAGEAG